MSNESLYFGLVFIDLAIALVAFRLGRSWLYAYIVTNLLLVTALAGKVVDVLGFQTTVAGPFYAAIFLATDALSEKYGPKEGHRSVAVGFGAQIMFVSLAIFSLQLIPVSFSAELQQSMEGVFDLSIRIVLASSIAYVISQNLDIWVFHKVKKAFNSKHLWLRNNVSTILSQIVDSLIFFSIAFYGVIPNWVEVALTGAIAKILIAMLDTPFLYLTKKIDSK